MIDKESAGLGSTVKSLIAQTRQGPVEYILKGTGPVVLICHGTSEDCHSGYPYEFLVEAGFTLLVPSRPGYGRTPLEGGRSNVETAQALISLLDCLDIQTCSVLAVSAGGPTGIALAASYPVRIKHLVLMAAVSQPEKRILEPSYKNQMAFYGPLHGMQWNMLRLISNISPHAMARQTLAIFSTHDTDDALKRLSPSDIESIRRFYQGNSSRRGALNDATHTVGPELLQAVSIPVLIVHSREDKSVPFSHAEWSMEHIPNVRLCESGFTGHFISVGPNYPDISKQIMNFLHSG